MATAEGAADALGPRYAPADPTLPEPWKGLIDGSTSVLYYWNPDTNITQYEKPTSLPPPLPLGPPPSAPKLAPIPEARAVQPNGAPGQQAHQVTQMSQPLGQEMNLMSQQNAEQMPQTAQQTSSQTPQSGHQLGLQASGTMQQLGQLTPQHLRPQMSHQTSQQQHQMFPTSEHQVPPLQGNQIPQMYQGGQLGQSQGYQFPPQQMQYMGYQNMSQQGPPNLLPQTQHTPLFSHQQDHKGSFMQREEPDYQQGKHVGFSPSQIHQSGVPPVQNPPAGSNSIQKPQLGIQPGQAPPYGGPSFSSQQPASLGQLQHGGMDLGHQQQAPRFQNQMGPGMMHGQPPNVPPAGLNMGYEENPPGRGGNDYYFNATNDSMTIAPNQPKLATIPMGRNQQEMRMGNLALQNISAANPVGANPVPGPTIYGGAPYPAGALMRLSPAIMSSPDAINLSSVDAYRKKHDVTVTGDNVPHPFMSFEDTGFPPEILREVRYLLQRRSICRTLHCFPHTCATVF